RVMEKRGQYKPIDLTVAVRRGIRGLAESLFYVAVPVGEHIDASEPADERALLVEVLDRVRDLGIIRTNERGIIVGWNRGASQIFGYTAEEAIGRHRRILQRQGKPPATPQLRRGEEWRMHRDGTALVVRSWMHEYRIDEEHGIGIEIVLPAASDADDARAAADAQAQLLRADLEKERRTNESLRQALQDLRTAGEEAMNELKVLTVALRSEIDQRQKLEEKLREAGAQRAEEEARTPPHPPVEAEREILQVAARHWERLNGRSVAEIIGEMGERRRTGTLVVERGSEVKELFFEEGKLFSCSSNNPDDFLTQRLMRHGYLTADDRRRALEIRQHTQLALGRLLLILGAISEEQLLEVMREKAIDQIFDLSGWRDARWTFFEGPIPALRLVPLSLGAGEILRSLQGPRPEPPPPAPPEPSGSGKLDVRDQGFEEVIVFDDGREGGAVSVLAAAEPEPAAGVATVAPEEEEERFIASAGARKYHRPSCRNAKRVAGPQRIELTLGEAAARGLEACKLCVR
ncbi:MAG TPA: DUF4388 domain-containing protein, partial [Thermoanaerobaculia bacterium]|nr:DUF4388 domain-containing protein [Thermoanaerobaculia bacterium]